MSIRHQLGKRIILARDPAAFAEGTLLGDCERHRARLADDPEFQRRLSESRAERRREILPFLATAFVANTALWGAAAYFLPGLVPPAVDVLGWLFVCALGWHTFWA